MLRLQHPRSHMSSKPAPVFHREALAWGVLLALALAAACWWWAIGRPVNLPDAPSSRIACVSYAPFREPGESPLDATAFISPARIDGDLRALSQRFDCVRTYSQGQGLSAVPQIAGRYGMQVLLGIWLGHDPQANAEQIRLGIATARKYPQVVRAVIVGNEVLLRGDLSSAQLAADLAQVRAAVPEPVSYADVWEFWLRHPELADSVDYLTIHILPYLEDRPVAPERAVQHVAAVYARVRQAFPDKRVMIGETGWPSAGRSRQAASASVVNEARYLREFLRYAAKEKLPYNVIEAFDQPWKRALEGTAGGYWGIFDVQARPKFPMQGPVTEDPRWWLGWPASPAAGRWPGSGGRCCLPVATRGNGPYRWLPAPWPCLPQCGWPAGSRRDCPESHVPSCPAGCAWAGCWRWPITACCWSSTAVIGTFRWACSCCPASAMPWPAA